MRIVVVGATGNVGTSVVTALGKDPQVSSIVGVARRLPGWAPPKTSWAQADVTHRRGLAELFRGADAVIHLAWVFGPPRHPRTTWRTNVLGSIHVFRAAAEAGVPALVYASSVGAYSPGPKDRKVDESWPTHGWPEAAYCREKAYLERFLDAYEHEHPAMRVVRMRPGFLFKEEAASEQRRIFAGPLLPRSLARPELLPVVPELPGLRFQVLHTSDAADAYRRAATGPDARGAFNLAAAPVVDARLLADLLGARVVRMPLPPVRTALAAAWSAHLVPASPELFEALLRMPLMDCARARRELGWSPRHSSYATLDAFFRGLRAGAGMDTPALAGR